MSKGRILVADDDPKIVATIRRYLEHDGYDVDSAGDGQEALERASANRPDLLVLDVMMPRRDGLDVCRALRSGDDVPIILLTARSTEEDRLIGLDLGADDYVTKPFSPRELVARVRAVLRRTGAGHGASVLRVRGLEVDLARRTVTVDGEPVELTRIEFDLLHALAASPGRVFTRSELIDRVLGWDFDGLDRTIDAHVMKLRKKIEPNRNQPSYVETVHGVGYRLSDGERSS